MTRNDKNKLKSEMTFKYETHIKYETRLNMKNPNRNN